MDKTVLVVILLIGLLFLFLLLNRLHEKHIEEKRKKALEYLMETTAKIYFYGQPVSKCIEGGVVRMLEKADIGDFAKIFGELVLYALFAQRNEMSWMYWRHWPEETDERGDLIPEHHSTYVVFRHDGKNWELDVRGRYLDPVNFRLSERMPDERYKIWTYPEKIPRNDRYLVENCTDPTRSSLRPDTYYRKASKEEIEHEVEHILEGTKTWSEY